MKKQRLWYKKNKILKEIERQGCHDSYPLYNRIHHIRDLAPSVFTLYMNDMHWRDQEHVKREAERANRILFDEGMAALDYVLRNLHKIKVDQENLLIMLSIYNMEDFLADEDLIQPKIWVSTNLAEVDFSFTKIDVDIPRQLPFLTAQEAALRAKYDLYYFDGEYPTIDFIKKGSMRKVWTRR